MSKTALLQKIFYRPLLKGLIPLVNQILTRSRKKVRTRLIWDNSIQRYLLMENNQLINVDVMPSWLICKSGLYKTVNRINLRHKELKEGSVVIDLGAGTGTESIVFSEMVGKSGKVYAIEAHPETYCSLSHLVDKGFYTNVTPVNLAIGDRDGEVMIEDQQAHEKNAVVIEDNKRDSGFKVKMITLDQMVEEFGIKKIDFLKVNIEGAEKYMLDGMVKSASIIESAAISCHDFLYPNGGPEIMNAVRAFFKDRGFEVIHEPNDHVVVNSWIYFKRKSS
ncbi:MAG: hypothetical protein RLY35_1961 [Bacteroidota bacterium]|jgi:FkbM family methyltransferase